MKWQSGGYDSGKEELVVWTEDNGKTDLLRLNFSQTRFYKIQNIILRTCNLACCVQHRFQSMILSFASYFCSSSLLRRQSEYWQSQERRHKQFRSNCSSDRFLLTLKNYTSQNQGTVKMVGKICLHLSASCILWAEELEPGNENVIIH